MIEGGGSKTMSKTKRWLYENPYDSHNLLDLLSNVIVDYLVCQVKSGAQIIQLFDTNAGYLGPKQFNEFCLPYLRKVANNFKEKLRNSEIEEVPLVVFAKDAHYALEELGNGKDFDVVSLDWTISPKNARASVANNVTLQGNLDPCALYSDMDGIDYVVSEMVAEFGTKNYIANLGHGIYPDMKPESMNTFVNAVHKHSRILNRDN